MIGITLAARWSARPTISATAFWRANCDADLYQLLYRDATAWCSAWCSGCVVAKTPTPTSPQRALLGADCALDRAPGRVVAPARAQAPQRVILRGIDVLSVGTIAPTHFSSTSKNEHFANSVPGSETCDLSTFLAAFLPAGAAIWRRLFGLRLLVVLLRGDIYNVGPGRYPFSFCERPVGDEPIVPQWFLLSASLLII